LGQEEGAGCHHIDMIDCWHIVALLVMSIAKTKIAAGSPRLGLTPPALATASPK
jgi:hypothetical protein